MSMNETLAAAFANIEKWEEEQAAKQHDSSAAARADDAIERLGITDDAEKAFIHEHERLHDLQQPVVTPDEISLSDVDDSDSYDSNDVDEDASADTWTHVADAATPLVRRAIQIKGLDEKAVLVQLQRSMYSPYKRDEAESAAYGAGNVNKHLFEGRNNRVRQTISKFSEVRTFFNDNTVPWATGVRMLNIDHYFDFTSKLRKLIDDALAAADDLAANWDHEVQADLRRLQAIAAAKGKPELANPDDYPSADEIRSRFAIDVRYMPVPTAGDFRVNISDEDKASLQKQLEDAEDAAAKHVITEMIAPMKSAVEKLNVPIGADGAIFRDSLIDNIVEVADRMGRVNLSDDPTITDKIAELKSLATTYANNKDVLRSMPDVRKKAATQISDLMTQMAGLV
jgi:hypothetical protein